jgi:hypothetical protein
MHENCWSVKVGRPTIFSKLNVYVYICAYIIVPPFCHATHTQTQTHTHAHTHVYTHTHMHTKNTRTHTSIHTRTYKHRERAGSWGEVGGEVEGHVHGTI